MCLHSALFPPRNVVPLQKREREKNPKVFSQASPSPKSTPSHLQTHQQTGRLCQPLASGSFPQLVTGEAGTSRRAVLQVFGDAYGSLWKPCPGSSPSGSLTTLPGESLKDHKRCYPRALGLLCWERLGAAGPAGAEVGRRSLSSEGRAEKMRSPAGARGRRPPCRASSPLSPPTLEPALGRAAGAPLETHSVLGATSRMGAAARTRPAGVTR